jgi:hypothetical protein
LITADTVAVETPAALATSLIVAAIGLQQIDLAHYRRIIAPRKAPESPAFTAKLGVVLVFSACASLRIGGGLPKRLVSFC